MRAQLAALACALSLAAPATALPPDAGVVLHGYATVAFEAGRGVSYRVGISAVVPAGPGTMSDDAYVYLTLTRCARECALTPTRWYVPLRPGQYDASDETRWSVDLTGFGRPLKVVWTGEGSTHLRPGDLLLGGLGGTAGLSWPAEATVSALGRSCTDSDALAERSAVYYVLGQPAPTDTFPARLPRGVPAGRTCRGV